MMMMMMMMAMAVIVIALRPAFPLMVVVLVVILGALQESLLALLFRGELHELHRRDLLLVSLHEFKREVHDLVLINRRT